MRIQQCELGKIKPYENNPRFNETAVDAVAASIKEFGWRSPLVVDENNVIICGHTRYKAALKLGLEEVPVHVAKDLSPEQVKAYRIADNKSGELAEWDFDKLKIELGDLSGEDFDLSLLAFDTEELEMLLNGDNNAVVTEGLTDPEDVPEAPEQPMSKTGELYRLGEHLLLCGDACKEDDLNALLGGRKVDMLLEDPPYNVSYEGATAEKLTITNDSMEDQQFLSFLSQAFGNGAKHMKKGAAFYIWYGDNEAVNFRLACKKAGLEIKQCLIWVKNQLVIGRQDYQAGGEPQVVFGQEADDGDGVRQARQKRRAPDDETGGPVRVPDVQLKQAGRYRAGYVRRKRNDGYRRRKNRQSRKSNGA